MQTVGFFSQQQLTINNVLPNNIFENAKNTQLNDFVYKFNWW